MLKQMTTSSVLWAVLGISAATLGGALTLQWQGYDPCHLCLLERWPYYAALGISPLLLMATGEASGLRRAGLALLGLIFLAGAGLSVYHAGIEWKWWPGPSTCSGNNLTGGLPDLTRKVVLCDQAALHILGLSLAAWNVLISAFLAILSLWAAFNRHGSSSVSQ